MNMGTSVCNKTPQNYKKGEEEQNRKGSGTLVTRVATVLSQTGDETDGTQVSEIPAGDTEGRAQSYRPLPLLSGGKGVGCHSHLPRRGPELGKRNGTA